MSYILDALRRADADRERERGAVPGLHARPMAGAMAEAPVRTPPAVWLAGASGLLALLAVVLWWVLRNPAPTPPLAAPPAAPPAAQTPPRQTPPLPTPPLPTPPPTPPLQAPAPQTPTAQLPPLPQSQQARSMASPPVQRQAPPPQARSLPPAAAAQQPLTAPPAAAAMANPPPPRPTVARPAPAAEPAAQRPMPLADLPAELRREMPPMTVGGSIYSDSAAGRFVIINGQVVREGEAPAPGVVLERINPKSAVLRWRELRIEVPL